MGDDYSTDRLDAATDVIFDHLLGEGIAATLTPKQREYWRDVLTKARTFEPQPLAASDDLTAILAAADLTWNHHFGDCASTPAYIRHLARCVTAGRALPYEPSGEQQHG